MKKIYSYDMALSAGSRNQSIDKYESVGRIMERADFEDGLDSQPTTFREAIGAGIPDETRDAHDYEQ